MPAHSRAHRGALGVSGLTSTIRNVWRTLRRICILILGFKGLIGQE